MHPACRFTLCITHPPANHEQLIRFYMTSLAILQQLDCPNKSSPHFPDWLTSTLYEEGQKDYIPKLQGGDVAWLVEYVNRRHIFDPDFTWGA